MPAQIPVKVGILSMGDMGSAMARLLLSKGFSVVTNCTGRSQHTIDRAHAAGVQLLASDEDLVCQCAVVLSVVPPRDAVETARRIVDALPTSGRPVDPPLYLADMNAVAPSTAKAIDEMTAAAGVRLIDGCILGGPPKRSAASAIASAQWHCPLMPTSGPYTLEDAMPTLADVLHSRHIGPAVGSASGLKMCFAAMSKGYAAIAIEAFTTAQRLGVLEDLQWAMETLVPARAQKTQAALTGMPPKAYRWVREMEEISHTFHEEAGFGPELFQGAADVFRIVADDTALGQERVGARQRGQTAEDVATDVAEGLAKKGQ